MFKQVLVPLDGSPAAESVLPYVRGLAGGVHAPVLLLHVIDPEAKAARRQQVQERVQEQEPVRHAEDEYLSQSEATDLAGEVTQRYLAAVAATFTGGPVGVETLVRTGPPAKVIINQAAIRPGTLIAMSTHGRTGIGRWLLGSVADRVLQATDSPLLLVRGSAGAHPVMRFDRVILPLDGSPLAETAFDLAVQVANSLRVPLLITGVVKPIITYYAAAGAQEGLISSIGAQESEEQTMEDYLERKVQQARAQAVANVSSVMPRGFPAGELVDLAQSYPHSLTVMSTHGRSGLGRWALGSVTDRVVRHTDQPVLVVRSAGG